MPHQKTKRPRSAEQEAADKRLADAVRSVQAGDKNAFRVLVERYQRPLYTVLMRYVTQQEDALDLAQRAFVRAYEQLSKLDKPDSFGAWLFRIGINMALNQRRSAASRNTTPLDDVAEPSVAPEAESVLILKERRRALRDALPKLSPMQREVLLLKLDGDLSYRAIADAIGSSEGAVRVHFHNATKRLRDLLAQAEKCSQNNERVTP